MYSIIKFIENVGKFFRIKLKIIYWKLKYGKRIKIGKKFRFRKGFIINISRNGYLEIGDNNMFGENVKMYDHNHIFNDKNINMQKSYIDKEVTIGNDNWIASNVTILSNTKLGNRNVVAANIVLNERYEDEYLIKEKIERKVEKIIFRED